MTLKFEKISNKQLWNKQNVKLRIQGKFTFFQHFFVSQPSVFHLLVLECYLTKDSWSTYSTNKLIYPFESKNQPHLGIVTKFHFKYLFYPPLNRRK